MPSYPPITRHVPKKVHSHSMGGRVNGVPDPNGVLRDLDRKRGHVLVTAKEIETWPQYDSIRKLTGDQPVIAKFFLGASTWLVYAITSRDSEGQPIETLNPDDPNGPGRPDVILEALVTRDGWQSYESGSSSLVELATAVGRVNMRGSGRSFTLPTYVERDLYYPDGKITLYEAVRRESESHGVPFEWQGSLPPSVATQKAKPAAVPKPAPEVPARTAARAWDDLCANFDVR